MGCKRLGCIPTNNSCPLNSKTSPGPEVLWNLGEDIICPLAQVPPHNIQQPFHRIQHVVVFHCRRLQMTSQIVHRISIVLARYDILHHTLISRWRDGNASLFLPTITKTPMCQGQTSDLVLHEVSNALPPFVLDAGTTKTVRCALVVWPMHIQGGCQATCKQGKSTSLRYTAATSRDVTFTEQSGATNGLQPVIQ